MTAPRTLTPQVCNHLLARYEVFGGTEVGAWLRRELAGLESFEQDLLLSPLFTPDDDVRLRFEAILGEAHLDSSGVQDLMAALAAQELKLVLLHEGDRVEAPLPGVVIERFVRLLHLDAPLPEEAVAAGPLPPAARCHLRDRAWQRPESRNLLPPLLATAEELGEEFPDYIRFFTDFLRTYRPASPQECLKALANLAQACKQDLEKHKSGARSFFNPELKAAYAGKWRVDQDVVSTHLRMIAMAERLLQVLGSSN